MTQNEKSILFENKQFLECKINYKDYEDFANKYYMASFYVKIDDIWILTKEEKRKKTKFILDDVINHYKLTYEYIFDDVHIEIPFIENMNSCSLFMYEESLDTNNSNFTYDNINKLINNIDKIPYHKHGVQNGICLSTSNKYKKELLAMCENTFSGIEFEPLKI